MLNEPDIRLLRYRGVYVMVINNQEKRLFLS